MGLHTVWQLSSVYRPDLLINGRIYSCIFGSKALQAEFMLTLTDQSIPKV